MQLAERFLKPLSNLLPSTGIWLPLTSASSMWGDWMWREGGAWSETCHSPPRTYAGTGHWPEGPADPRLPTSCAEGPSLALTGLLLVIQASTKMAPSWRALPRLPSTPFSSNPPLYVRQGTCDLVRPCTCLPVCFLSLLPSPPPQAPEVFVLLLWLPGVSAWPLEGAH